MTPTNTTLTPAPWWTHAKSPYAGPTPVSLRTAESAHPHWAETRLPGRAVRRQQARRLGILRPRLIRRHKRRTGPLGRIFNSGASMPLVPSFLQQFLGRQGDR